MMTRILTPLTMLLVIGLAGCDSGDPADDDQSIVVVQVSPSNVELAVGEQVQLAAYAVDGAGLTVVGVTFEWFSSDDDIASVTAQGLVTAHRSGTAVISARAQGVVGGSVVDILCGEPVQVTSHLTEATVWESQGIGCVDYVVHGVRRVEASLEVGPGTWIEFKSGAALHQITGSAYMAFKGVDGMPIRMFGEVASPGFWRGLGFWSSDVRNEVTHTTILHAGVGQLGLNSATLTNTAIGVRGGARVAISNTVIEDSGGFGVRATETGTSLEGWANNRFVRAERAPVAVRASYLRYLDEGTNYMDGEPHGEPFVLVPTSEFLNQAQTWPNTVIPIRFTSGSRHVLGNHLTIRPGTTIEFTGAGFDIGTNGALTADGTTGTITFRGATGTPGEWQGLIFEHSTTVNNRFVNTVISDAGGGTAGIGGQRSNIRLVQHSRVEIHDSVIGNSDHCGIWVGGNNNTLIQSGNTFADNAGGDICVPS